MGDKTLFFTRTMAKVHAKQGNPEKAAEIYRYLLDTTPDTAELAQELAAVEKQIVQKTQGRLVGLFESWFDLVFTYNRLKKLKKLKNHDDRILHGGHK